MIYWIMIWSDNLITTCIHMQIVQMQYFLVPDRICRTIGELRAAGSSKNEKKWSLVDSHSYSFIYLWLSSLSLIHIYLCIYQFYTNGWNVSLSIPLLISILLLIIIIIFILHVYIEILFIDNDVWNTTIDICLSIQFPLFIVNLIYFLFFHFSILCLFCLNFAIQMLAYWFSHTIQFSYVEYYGTLNYTMFIQFVADELQHSWIEIGGFFTKSIEDRFPSQGAAAHLKRTLGIHTPTLSSLLSFPSSF